MKNIKSAFYITLVINGFIISTGIAFSIRNPDTKVFSNWLVLIVIMSLVVFFGTGYAIIRGRTLCQFFCKQFNKGKNESSSHYRIEKYILRWWKYPDSAKEISTSVDLINNPGRRSRYSDDEKLRVVGKWESIKQHPNGITLEEFLEHEFGITNGVLNVSKSSFYSWRRKFKNRIEEQ